MMNAASAAGQVVAQTIGAVADEKQREAQKEADAAKAAGQTELAAQYQAEANSWAEGGTNRVVLHTAGGAAIAGLGGGNALGGAAGAGLAAAMAGKLNGLADSIGDGTGSMLVGNIAANVLAGAGGALIGGNSGAFAAANADLYNRSSGNADGKGGTGSDFLNKASSIAAGTWNSLVSIGEMVVNIPNGGPLAAPGDPGYLSADKLRFAYAQDDQLGPDVELLAALLATKRVGKGNAVELSAEVKAISEVVAFEKSLVRLPPGERVAIVKHTAQSLATENNWTKDSQLTRLNGRDVYRANDGTLYAVDTQHARFEVINGKNGAHMGEVSMHNLKPTKPADLSGRHNLRLK